MENFRQRLGQKIRKARARLGFSQQDLATQAGFSAHQTISTIENGEREVKELVYKSIFPTRSHILRR